MVLISLNLAESVAVSDITYQIHPVWVVSNKTPKGDFDTPLEDLLLTYIRSQWVITDPTISVSPPSDFSTKIRFGDFQYDYFSTYYIRIKEDTTEFNNDLIMDGCFQLSTRVFIDLTARRLSTGEHFSQLNNMRLEISRILGNFRPDDISGIHAIGLELPGERDIEPRVLEGQRSIWYLRIIANLQYIKYYS